MKNIKPFCDYDEQVAELRKKGCLISDDNICKSKLINIGYYRLKAYTLTFKRKDGTYKDGFSFYRVSRLYDFDKELRALLSPIIETIEISWRARLVYFHAQKYGPLGYLDEKSFGLNHNHIRFKAKIEELKEQYKTLLFVKHYNEQYNGVFPLWVIAELFTFGTTSYFYDDLLTSDKKAFAGVNYEKLSGWLRCCTDLRNICAHHGRLYYRIFTSMPAGFNISENEARRLWGAILAVRALYPDEEEWNSKFIPRLSQLFDDYCDAIDLYHMAFPVDWKDKLKK